MVRQLQQTVLLVDGEPLVLDVCSAVLKSSGYKVLCCLNGKMGLQLFRETASVDLVVSDVIMPDLSGPDMTSQMLVEKPGLKVLFMSGYGAAVDFPVGLDNGIRLLEKPFTSEHFLQTVQFALASASSA